MRTPFVVVLVVAMMSLTSFLSAGQESVDTVLERVERAEVFESGDAVILLDAGETTVHLDGTMECVSHEQILLKTWDAVDAYGEIELTYTETLETLEVIYVRTVLSDGEIVDVEASDIVYSRYSEGGESEAYGALKTVSLQMPALSPGVVIDYAYRRVLVVPTFENEIYDYWYFEWWDPVLQSEYVVDAPAGMDLAWRVGKRTLDPEIQTSSARVRYVFLAETIDPLSYEPNMPDEVAIEPYVALSTIDSWEEISSWWWTLASEAWAETPDIEAQAEALIAGCATDDERIAALYDYVARDVRYAGLGLGTNGYEPRAAFETLSTKYGDCKDQAALLVSLLHAIDIEAYPLLMNAANGFHLDWSEPPMPIAFNHVIVAIPRPDGTWQYLDPTCSLCTSGNGGTFLWGRDGLLIVPDPNQFDVRVAIPSGDPAENLVRCTLEGSLSASNAMSWNADIECLGENDLAMRDLFLYFAPDGQGDLCAALVDYSLSQALLIQYTYSDPEDLAAPFRYVINYRKSRAVRWLSGGTGLLPLPYGPSVPLPGDYGEFLYPEDRMYPLVCSAERVELAARIDIGDVEVVELPQDVTIQNAIGSFHARYSQDDGAIVYERVIQIDVMQIEPEEFDMFCDLVLAMWEDEEAVAVLRNE